MARLCMLLALPVAGLLVLACGDEASMADGHPEMEPVAQEETTPEEPEAPAAMGERVGQLYIDVLRQARDLLDGNPPVEDVRSDFAAMKARHVQELVALGKKREELDDDARSEFDREARMKMRSVDDELFTWFQEAVSHYRSVDSEFAENVASLNLLTQYAFFELLRKQQPEESERLGIDQ